MKINCNVEVINRSVQQYSTGPRKKAQRSSLTIGRLSVKNDELHLLLQTAQNKLGTKYKIDDNIAQVFTKFVKNGKATIRLKEPPHDLNIKGDEVQLKGFLNILKQALSKTVNPAVLNVSNLNSKSIVQLPRTKVTIKSKADYPVLQGFPRTTEMLTIVDLERKSFDRQILKLQSLRILNLSNNHISSLPKELGKLPQLMELSFSNNCLGKGANKWAWITEGTLSKTLRLLDLSGNDLTRLPSEIGKLRSLVTLNVSRNTIKVLPQSIGVLSTLKYLDITQNAIRMLPGSLKNLRLEEAKIAGNPYASEISPNYTKNHVGPMSLVELGGRAVLNHRILYDASIIPYTLLPILNNSNYCPCGSACIREFLHDVRSFDVNSIARVVAFGDFATVGFDFFFCSHKCLSKPIH